jgi:hypothetical protein
MSKRKKLRCEAYELYIEERISWELNNIIVNRLTKPPLNVHSCCSLVCTIANSPGVRAANSSPYTVRDAKVLLCQGRVAVMAGSSSGCGRAVIPPRIEGPLLDIQERFTRVLGWERGRFIPVALTFGSTSMDWVLYASPFEIRLAVVVGKTSGEPPSRLSSEMFFWI